MSGIGNCDLPKGGECQAMPDQKSELGVRPHQTTPASCHFSCQAVTPLHSAGPFPGQMRVPSGIAVIPLWLLDCHATLFSPRVGAACAAEAAVSIDEDAALSMT